MRVLNVCHLHSLPKYFCSVKNVLKKPDNIHDFPLTFQHRFTVNFSGRLLLLNRLDCSLHRRRTIQNSDRREQQHKTQRKHDDDHELRGAEER